MDHKHYKLRFKTAKKLFITLVICVTAISAHSQVAPGTGPSAEIQPGTGRQLGSPPSQGPEAAQNALPVTQSNLTGPTLEETTKFILDHSVVGSPVAVSGSWSGQRRDKIEVDWTWTNYSFSGCKLTAGYTELVSVLEEQPQGPRKQAYASSMTSPGVYDLGLYHSTDVVIINRADELTDKYRSDGTNLVISLVPGLYEVGARTTTTGTSYTPKPEFKSRISAQDFLTDPQKHPEHWDIRQQVQTTTNALFVSDDRSMAVRAAKALTHAIALCGGKPEAF